MHIHTIPFFCGLSSLKLSNSVSLRFNSSYFSQLVSLRKLGYLTKALKPLKSVLYNNILCENLPERVASSVCPIRVYPVLVS